VGRSVLRFGRYTGVACVVLTLGLLAAPLASAASETTAPGRHVLVYFVITDKGIRYEILRETAGGGTNELTLEKYVFRGDLATFFVINRGHKRHGFSFDGRHFSALRPGTRAHFTTTLLRRGSYAYQGTPDNGKSFRGVFPVE
jgi:hypothetical protein